MRAKTKELMLGSERYQVGKMDPQTCAWILNLILAEAGNIEPPKSLREKTSGNGDMPKLSDEEQANGTVVFLWSLAGTKLERSVYREIQDEAMGVCSWYPPNSQLAVPVKANGKYACLDLEDDPVAVNRLIIEALQFNIASFFTDDALSQARASAQDSRPQSASR